MVNGLKLPVEWLERVEDILAGRVQPPKPRDAATVAVLRDYVEHGLQPIPDNRSDTGPIGGLEALASACGTEWLLTMPVDLVGINECLLPGLQFAAVANGAFAEDDDGPQPLVALWRTDSLRVAASAAIDAHEFAVHALQQKLGMACVRFNGVRFGNLNTPDDLKASGFSQP